MSSEAMSEPVFVTLTDGNFEVRVPVDRSLLEDPRTFGEYVAAAWKEAVRRR